MKEYVYHDVNYRGTIEKVTYQTTNQAGEKRDKYALVYLPKGYDRNDGGKKYNILYLMHGGGGNPDAWLDCCKVKNMLDHSIDSGELNPLIVVFPSYYKEVVPRVGRPDAPQERENVLFFQKELSQDLLPAIESKYHTYAVGVDSDSLKASRSHRAFGGFSMGSCTTWFALMNNLDYFSRFVPLSGDCWIIEPMGGSSCPPETARAIYDSIVSAGYGSEDFHIFCATGTKDPAYASLTPQIEEMKKLSDLFLFSEDWSKGNLHYTVVDDLEHAYESVNLYLYNYIPYLFD